MLLVEREKPDSAGRGGSILPVGIEAADPMSQSAPSPYSLESISEPLLGTVPLGPDEPELFASAMERILEHLDGPRWAG